MVDRTNKSWLLAGAVSLVAMGLLTGCHKSLPKHDPNSTVELVPSSIPQEARKPSGWQQVFRPVKLVFVTFPGFILDHFTGNTPLDNAQRMEDPTFPDERRRGIYATVEPVAGRVPPYTERYAQLAQLDTDTTVRVAAIRALNISRDKTATDAFIRALSDPNVTIRLEGAKALGNVPDEKAVPALIKVMNSTAEDKDVRVAAARALVFYRRLDVGRALIGVLQDKDFAVSWQARQTLMFLTGKDYRYSESAWLELITSDAKPLG